MFPIGQETTFPNDVLDQMESEGMCADDSASDSRWGRGRVGEGEAHTRLPEIAQ